MKKFNVGIIGNGFVGESQAFAFSPTCNITIYDKDPLKSLNSLEEVSILEVKLVLTTFCTKALSKPAKSSNKPRTLSVT